MKLTKTLTLLFALLVGSSNLLFAQDSTKKTSPIRFLVTGGLELGGDEVAKVYFTNGNTQSVRAGQGGSIAVGAQLQLPSVEQFLLRATVGYKYVTTAADNVHIRLTRIPVVFTGNWMATKKLRFGAGLAMHNNIKFKADGLGDDIPFEGASGPTFEVGYSGIGLTYTAMNYKDKDKHSYSANAIGLSFSFTIPGK
jgi:hypothetical protein